MKAPALLHRIDWRFVWIYFHMPPKQECMVNNAWPICEIFFTASERIWFPLGTIQKEIYKFVMFCARDDYDFLGRGGKQSQKWNAHTGFVQVPLLGP